MRRRVAALCFAGALALLCALAGATTLSGNLLTNAGFETNAGEGTAAAAWTSYSQPNSYSASSAFARSGTWSARVVGADGVVRAAKQIVSFGSPSMQGIHFAGYAVSQSVSIGTAASFCMWADVRYDDDTFLFAQVAPFSVATPSTFVLANTTVCPRRPVAEIWLHALLSRSGTAYFDDVALQRVVDQGTSALGSTVAVSGNNSAAGTPLQLAVVARTAAGVRVPCGGDTVSAAVSAGPQTPSLSVADHGNASYSAGATLTIAGQYLVALEINSVALPGWPAVVVVRPDAARYDHTLVAAPFAASVSAGLPARLVLLPRDRFDNAVESPSATVTALSMPALAGGGELVVSGNATHAVVTLNTTHADTYSIDVRVNGVSLAGAPFTVVVAPRAASPPSFTAASLPTTFGPLTPTRFVVQARDELGNAVTNASGIVVSVSAVAAPSFSSSVVDFGNGTYAVTFSVAQELNFALLVRANGVDVVGSPFNVTSQVQAFDASRSSASGNYTREVEVQRDIAIGVALFDSVGNPFRVRNPGSVSVVKQSPAGGVMSVQSIAASTSSHVVNVSLSFDSVNVYQVALSIDGQAAPGSPFAIDVRSVAPRVSTYVADDPQEYQVGLSNGDALVLTFDMKTNRPSVADRAAVDAQFSFTGPIGANYKGTWSEVNGVDVCTIELLDVTGAQLQLQQSRVTPVGTIRSQNGVSARSYAASPTLGGDFGTIGCWPYGVWFGGLCWWVWVIIFCIIGSFVLGCIVFWVCLWRGLRSHVRYMEKLGQEEMSNNYFSATDAPPGLESHMQSLRSLRSIRSMASKRLLEQQRAQSMRWGKSARYSERAMHGVLPVRSSDVSPTDEAAFASGQLAAPSDASSAGSSAGAGGGAGAGGLGVPQDFQSRRRTSLLNMIKKWAGVSVNDETASQLAAAGPAQPKWRQRSSSAAGQLGSAPAGGAVASNNSTAASAMLPKDLSMSMDSLKVGSPADARRPSTHFDVANIRHSVPASGGAAALGSGTSALALPSASSAPVAGRHAAGAAGGTRRPSFLANDTIVYDPDRRGSSMVSGNSSFDADGRGDDDDMVFDANAEETYGGPLASTRSESSAAAARRTNGAGGAGDFRPPSPQLSPPSLSPKQRQRSESPPPVNISIHLEPPLRM